MATEVFVNAQWTNEAAFNADTGKPADAVWGTNAFSNLTDAVNAASATEETVITVAAGTYAEDITLDARSMAQKGNIKFIAADGADVTFSGIFTIGYYEKRVGALMWNADVTFENITFDQATAEKHSIDIQQCNDFTMTNCKVVGDGEYGVLGTNVDNGATITGCTFENAGIQSAGNFGTNLLIDDCTFDESKVNLQSGNSATISNCTFTSTLTDVNLGDSFYAVRTNDVPVNIENTVFNIDSELTGDAGEQAKWGVLWARNAGSTKWNVENIEVNVSEAAMQQSSLFIAKNGTTTEANKADRIVINGLVSTENDIEDLLAKSEGMLNVIVDGTYTRYENGEVTETFVSSTIYVSNEFSKNNVGEGMLFGFNAFADVNSAAAAAEASAGKLVVVEGADVTYTANQWYLLNTPAKEIETDKWSYDVVVDASETYDLQIDGTLSAYQLLLNNAETVVSESGKLFASGETLRVMGGTFTVEGNREANAGAPEEIFTGNWGIGTKPGADTQVKAGYIQINQGAVADFNNTVVFVNAGWMNFNDAAADFSNTYIYLGSGGSYAPIAVELVNGAEVTFADNTTVINDKTFTMNITVDATSTLTLDATSSITATTLAVADGGKFIIDATNFYGVKKIVDIAGSESLEGKVTINGDGVSAVYGTDGDVTLVKVDMSTIYVNAAFSGEWGTDLGDGKFMGINAFATTQEAYKAARNIGGEITIDLTGAGAESLGGTIGFGNAGNNGYYTITGGSVNTTSYGIYINNPMDITVKFDNAMFKLAKLYVESANGELIVNNSVIGTAAYSGHGSGWVTALQGDIKITDSIFGMNFANYTEDEIKAMPRSASDVKAAVAAGTYKYWAFGSNNSGPHMGTTDEISVTDSTLSATWISLIDRAEMNLNNSVLYYGAAISIGACQVDGSLGNYDSNEIGWDAQIWWGSSPAASKDGFREGEVATMNITDSIVRNIGSGNGNAGAHVQVGGSVTYGNTPVVGQEFAGVLNLKNSEFHITPYDAEGNAIAKEYDFLAVKGNGTVNMDNSTLVTAKVINDGEFYIKGEETSTLNIGTFTGNAIEVVGGGLKDSNVGGANVLVTGDAVITGEGTFGNVKVNNGAELVFDENAKVVSPATFIGAGNNDDTYAGLAGSNAENASGKVTVAGNVSVQQVNANASGEVVVADGGELTTQIICVENGGIEGAAAGSLTVEADGKIYTQRFNVFAGATATIKGYASSEQAYTSAQTDNVISVWDGGTLTIDGGVFSAAHTEHTEGRLSGVSIGSEDAQLNIINGGMFYIGGVITNAGTITVNADSSLIANAIAGDGSITVDLTGFSGINKVIDLSGTESLEGKVTVKGEGASVFYGADGDVVVGNVDMTTIYVNSEYEGIFGDDLGDGKYLGINGFDNLTDAVKAAEKVGGATIDLTNEAYSGNMNGSADARLFQNNGVYTFTNGNYIDFAYVATPSPTEDNAGFVSVHIVFDGAKVTAGKFRLDNGSSLTITDSYLDGQKAGDASAGWTTFYGDSTVTISNSVVGWNYYVQGIESSTITAGDQTTDYTSGEYKEQLGEMCFWGSSVMTVENSTIFTYVDEGTAACSLGIYDKGLMSFKDSAVYAQTIMVGVAGKKTVGRDDEVATMTFDNSTLRNTLGRVDERIIVGDGGDTAGALIFRNSTVEKSGAKVTVNSNGSLDIKSSDFNVNTVDIAEDGKVTVSGESSLNIGTLNGALTFDNADLIDSSLNKGDVYFKGENTYEGDFNVNRVFVGDWANAEYDGSVNFGADSNVKVNGQMIIGYDTLVPGANNVVFGDTTGEIITDKVFYSADVSIRRDGSLTIANTSGENKINTMNVMGSLTIDNAQLTGEMQIGGTGNGIMTAKNGAVVKLGGSSNSVVVLGKSTKGTLNVDDATVTVVRCGSGGSYKVPADTFVIGYNGGVGVLNVTNNGKFVAADYNGDKDGGKMNVQVNGGSEINVASNGSVDIAGSLDNAGTVNVADGGIVDVAEVTNNGSVLVSGESASTLVIDKLTGNAVEVTGGGLKDSQLGGSVNTVFTGDAALEGKNTLAGINKVINGSTLTIDKDADVTAHYLMAGEDNYFDFGNDQENKGGTIDINGKLNITQNLNANANGIVNINSGADVKAAVVAVENGEITDAESGVLNVDGKLQSTFLNVFSGGTANIGDTGYVQLGEHETDQQLLQLRANSTVNVAGELNIKGSGTVEGALNVDNGVLSVSKTLTVVKNDDVAGSVYVTGESTVNINELKGSYVKFENASIVNDSTIGGNIRAYENFDVYGNFDVKQSNLYGTTVVHDGAVYTGSTTIVGTGGNFTLENGGTIKSRFFNVVGGTADIYGDIELEHSDPRQKSLQIHDDGVLNLEEGGNITVTRHNAIVNAGCTLNVNGGSLVATPDTVNVAADRGGVLYNAGTVNVNSGSVDIKNLNNDAEAVVNINGGVVDISDTFTNNGSASVSNADFTTGTLINEGTFDVAGESTLIIGNQTGTINVKDGAVITDSQVGNVNVYGTTTWQGTNTIGAMSLGWYNSGADIVTNITGTATVNNFMIYNAEGFTSTLNIGDADGERTTIKGNQHNYTTNSVVNVVNADITGNYASMTGVVTVTDSTYSGFGDFRVVAGGNHTITPEVTFIGSSISGSYGYIGGWDASESGYGVLTLTDESTWQANSGSLTTAASQVTVSDNSQFNVSGTFTHNGTLTVDTTSSVTVKKLVGNGTITVDAEDFTGVAKVVDVTSGSTFSGTINVVNNDNASIFRNSEGDVFVTTADSKTVYYNYSYAGSIAGDVVGDGRVFGFNAFDKIDYSGKNAAGWSNLTVLPENTEEVVLAAGNSNEQSYGMLRPTQELTVTTEGDGYAVIDRVVNMGVDLTIAEDAKIKVLCVGNLSGANNQGGALIINGELYFANANSSYKAIYLWGMNSTPGQIVINAGGLLKADCGNIENHGTITVLGKMELGAAGDAPKLAGVGANNGGWHGHLVVDGKDGEGIVSVAHNQLNFGGGNTYVDWQEPAGECSVEIINGGKVTTAAVSFRNGAKNTLTITNGTLEFTNNPDYANLTPRYFDNQGVINAVKGVIDMTDRKFTNDGTITLADSMLTVSELVNNAEMEITGGEIKADILNNTADGSLVAYGNSELEFGNLTNNGEFILKDNVSLTLAGVVNNSTVTLDDFNGTLDGFVKGDDVAKGNIKVLGDSAIADTVDTGMLSVGGWDEFENGVAANDKLTITEDGVVSAAKVYVQPDGKLDVKGDLNVIGKYNGVDGVFANYGVTDVSGVMNVTNDASNGENVIGNAELDNSSIALNIKDGGIFNLNTTEGRTSAKLNIVAGAELNVEAGGTFNGDAASVVNNYGTVNVEGNVDIEKRFNNGSVLNIAGGEFYAGELLNGSDANSNGTITLTEDAVLHVGKLSNSKDSVIELNVGSVIKVDTATFVNNGLLNINIANTVDGVWMIVDSAKGVFDFGSITINGIEQDNLLYNDKANGDLYLVNTKSDAIYFNSEWSGSLAASLGTNTYADTDLNGDAVEIKDGVKAVKFYAGTYSDYIIDRNVAIETLSEEGVNVNLTAAADLTVVSKFELNAGSVFTVAENGSLTVEANAVFNGSIVNDGKVTANGKMSADVVNNGTFTVNGTVNAFGNFTNNGEVVVGEDGVFIGTGDFVNGEDGKFTVKIAEGFSGAKRVIDLNDDAEYTWSEGSIGFEGLTDDMLVFFVEDGDVAVSDADMNTYVFNSSWKDAGYKLADAIKSDELNGFFYRVNAFAGTGELNGQYCSDSENMILYADKLSFYAGKYADLGFALNQDMVVETLPQDGNTEIEMDSLTTNNKLSVVANSEFNMTGTLKLTGADAALNLEEDAVASFGSIELDDEAVAVSSVAGKLTVNNDMQIRNIDVAEDASVVVNGTASVLANEEFNVNGAFTAAAMNVGQAAVDGEEVLATTVNVNGVNGVLTVTGKAVIAAGAVVNVAEGATFTVNGTMDNNGVINITDAALTAGAQINNNGFAKIVISGKSTVNATVTGDGQLRLLDGATLSGSLTASVLYVEGDAFFAKNTAFAGYLNGKTVYVADDQNKLNITKGSTAVLKVADGTVFQSGDDYLGDVVIKGDGKNVVITAADDVFDGNILENVKLNITGVYDNWVNVDIALENVLTVNGFTLHNDNGVYFYKDGGNNVFVSRVEKDGQYGIQILGGSVTVAVTGNINVKSDYSEFAGVNVIMSAGTASVAISGKKNDVTEFTLGSILKDKKGGVNNVKFGNYTEVEVNGVIDSLGSLSIGNFADVTIGAVDNGEFLTGTGNVTGQNTNNSIKVGTDSTVEIGGDIDLMGGKNTLSVGARSSFEVAGSVSGVAAFTIANGKAATKTSGEKRTVVSIDGMYTAAEMNNKITVGNYADLSIGQVDGISIDNGGVSSGTGTTVKVGKDASLVAAGSVNGIAAMTIGQGAEVTLNGALAGTAKNNKISVGAEAMFKAGNIDLAAGKNTIASGKNATVEVGSIANVQTITVGTQSSFTADSITGVNKFTVNNGKAATKKAEAVLTEAVIKGDVLMTDGKDTFKVGSNSEVKVLGNNDRNSENKIFGEINFGAGKDTLTMGKDSKLFVGDISGLEVFNAAKGATIEIANGADNDVYLDDVTGSWNKATIIDYEGELGAGFFSGSVYANETDAYELNVADGQKFVLDYTSEDVVITYAEFDANGELGEFKLYETGMELAAGHYGINVAVAGDYEDKVEKKGYDFIAKLA